VPTAATAAYPGSNGPIFFQDSGAIFSIRPDGSDRQRLVDSGRQPAVSADGRTIVFQRSGNLYTANRSGGEVIEWPERRRSAAIRSSLFVLGFLSFPHASPPLASRSL
jgi:hypothetical protein